MTVFLSSLLSDRLARRPSYDVCARTPNVCIVSRRQSLNVGVCPQKLPRRRNAEPPERFPRGSPIFFVLIERGVLLSVLGGGGGAGCRDLTMREQIASGAALRDFNPAFVRFGSGADITRHLANVRFASQSGHAGLHVSSQLLEWIQKGVSP